MRGRVKANVEPPASLSNLTVSSAILELGLLSSGGDSTLRRARSYSLLGFPEGLGVEAIGSEDYYAGAYRWKLWKAKEVRKPEELQELLAFLDVFYPLSTVAPPILKSSKILFLFGFAGGLKSISEVLESFLPKATSGDTIWWSREVFGGDATLRASPPSLFVTGSPFRVKGPLLYFWRGGGRGAVRLLDPLSGVTFIVEGVKRKNAEPLKRETEDFWWHINLFSERSWRVVKRVLELEEEAGLTKLKVSTTEDKLKMVGTLKQENKKTEFVWEEHIKRRLDKPLTIKKEKAGCDHPSWGWLCRMLRSLADCLLWFFYLKGKKEGGEKSLQYYLEDYWD